MKTLFASRRFWAAVFMLAAVILTSFLPDIGPRFEARVEDLAAGAVVIVSFMIGLAVDPGTGWGGLLRSRKFWAAVIGFLVIVLDVFGQALPFDLSPEQLITVCVTIGGYIFSVAFEHKALDVGDWPAAVDVKGK